jgi:gluconokinase
MKIEGLRSPSEQVGGIVYFGRMVDKIHLHQAGRLPEDYVANLGTGFDGRACSFLRIDYPALVERVKQGGTEEELLEWAFAHGRKPIEEEIEIWNDFMSKRGWNDPMSARLAMRLKEGGFENRTDIQTFFGFIDLDEGRL